MTNNDYGTEAALGGLCLRVLQEAHVDSRHEVQRKAAFATERAALHPASLSNTADHDVSGVVRVHRSRVTIQDLEGLHFTHEHELELARLHADRVERSVHFGFDHN